jgi:hypothetical protein
MGQKAKAQWELYTDEELAGGAQRWGLTLQQERQRLCLLQSDFRQWPTSLLAFLKSKHSSGLEFVGFTVISHSVVAWLKEGNTAELLPVEEAEIEMAVAAAA